MSALNASNHKFSLRAPLALRDADVDVWDRRWYEHHRAALFTEARAGLNHHALVVAGAVLVLP
jgi:hypothetical protein